MKNFLSQIIVLIFSTLLFVSCSSGSSNSSEPVKEMLSGEKRQANLTNEERIDLVKKRRNDLDAIRKGDYYSANNNPEEALTYYLPVLERLPDDVLLQKKIGHAYYQKKDWKNAYNSYVHTPINELTPSERQEFLSSLFFDESQNNRLGELSHIELGRGELDWYTLLDTCHTGIHNCIVSIQSYSGSEQNIIKMQSIIKDSETVSPDYQYRNFAVATKFYELGAYRVSALMTEEILHVRPDYAGVEKLLGFSYAELGNLSGAKKELLSTLERDPTDLDTIVELGNIFLEMHDYTSANLYYNNAILAGYTPKTTIERKLAYSYSRLSDTESMLKVLAYLLTETDTNEDDAVVAISLALQHGENLKAYVWATNAVHRYPNSEKVISIYITSMRTIGKEPEALEYINALSGSVVATPIVKLEKAILLMDAGDHSGAKTLFTEVRDVDPESDFGMEAANYLDLLESQSQRSEPPSSDTGKAWWQ